MLQSRIKEYIVKYTLLVVAFISIFVIFFIFYFLFKEAYPAFDALGLDIFSVDFSRDRLGLGGAIRGSLLVTAGALLIAYPLGIGGGIFLSEVSPGYLRRFLKPVIELLAGIPSVIYGFIAAVIMAPMLGETFGMLSGVSYLAGGIIIGVMTLPIIVSITDDSLKAVPRGLKEASWALGATRWQTTKKVTFPAASSGVFAAATLGIGKAIGETMAVFMVMSATVVSPEPWFDIFSTGPVLTSLIAGHMGEAYGLKVNALFAAGVFLFIIAAVLAILAEYMQYRIEKKFKGH